MTVPADVERQTRLEVRTLAAGFVVATLGMVAWPGLTKASNALVIGVFAMVGIGTSVIATGLLERRWPLHIPRRGAPAARTHWSAALWVGYGVGFILASFLIPLTAYRGFGLREGLMDLPLNAARTCIVVVGVGLAAWLVALMLPTEGRPLLVRLRDWPPASEPRPGPIDPLDLLLFLLALGVVVVPPMSVANALTAPFAWPLPQFGAACLLLQTLLKRQSLAAGLLVYRIVFVIYAIFLVRLALGAAAGLDTVGASLLTLALVGVLIIDARAYVLAARTRVSRPRLRESRP